MDERLLQAVDDAAARRHVSRSGFISQTLRAELGQLPGPGQALTVHQALANLAGVFGSASFADARDSTEVIREMRDAR
ncbi:MAG: hypothetical protein ACRDHX_08165 [Chloroflexota bacterium]